MERTLHRQLKEFYGLEQGGSVEARVAGFRIDAIEADGTLVEVQTGSIGPLRKKLQVLLGLGHRLRLVKPVVARKRILRRTSARGRVLGARQSPKAGRLVDVFEDLVGAAGLLASEGLLLEVALVSIEETRVTRRRWPGYSVQDRVLEGILSRVTIESAVGLWSLLPCAEDLPVRFTTHDLAAHCAIPIWAAQRVAYCLHHAGVAPRVGKAGNRRVYEKRIALG